MGEGVNALANVIEEGVFDVAPGDCAVEVERELQGVGGEGEGCEEVGVIEERAGVGGAVVEREGEGGS